MRISPFLANHHQGCRPGGLFEAAKGGADEVKESAPL
jgi:hypothetical protein